ncbi:MAG: M3 family metallopeptidase [Pseudomonas sp.]
MYSDNPFLQNDQPLDYAAVRLEHLRAAVEQIISDNRSALDVIIEQQRTLPTWDDLVLAVDALDARLNNTLYRIAPLLSLEGDWQEAANECWDLAQAYFLQNLQNAELLSLYERLAASTYGMNLDRQRKAALQRTLKTMRLSGVHLTDTQREQLQALEQRISDLQNAFFDNVVRSGEAWSVHIMDEQRLRGIPALNRGAMAAAAHAKALSGWLITLEEAPCLAVIEHAQDRDLREQVYRAWMTRAVSQEPGEDNGEIFQDLADARQEKARLLGFDRFPLLNLQRKGGVSQNQVTSFLQQLSQQAKPGFEQERKRLQDFAQQQGLAQVQPWDVAFLRKQARQMPLSLSEDEVHACFSLDTVIKALVDLARQLFGVELRETPTASWHPSVRTFEVEQDNALQGHLSIDVIARDGKHAEGAWTYYLSNRHIDAEGRYHGSAVAMFASVAAGQGNVPPLLSHLDLRKVFHEFGHCLHHLLVRTNNYHLSDVQNLGPGGFEVAGKLLERWCWSAQYLASISSHYLTGAPLSAPALQTFLEQLQAQEQSKLAGELAKALFDMDLHNAPDDGRSVQQRVEDSFSVAGAWPLADFERPLHAFDHLVTGYEAGYFGYLWADVHAFDLFSRFEQEGLLNRATGRELHELVFMPGASQPIQMGGESFLKRPLSAAQFLRWHGLSAS